MSFLIKPCKSLSTSDIYKLLSKDEYAKKDFKNVLPYDCLSPRPQYSRQIQSLFSTACGYYSIYFILLKSRNFCLNDIQN